MKKDELKVPSFSFGDTAVIRPLPSADHVPIANLDFGTIKEMQMKKDEFDKVDRALECAVIDWLQWTEFPEDIRKSMDDSNYAQLALKLLDKRRKAYDALMARKCEKGCGR